MSEMKAVLGACKEIEHVLETHWRGRGKGMHGKLDTVAYPVPSPLARRIRWLATMRNKAVHEVGFEIPDINAYMASARQALAELQHELPQAVASYRRRLRRRTFAAVVVVVIAVLWLWVSASKADGERARLESERVTLARPQLPSTSTTPQAAAPQAAVPQAAVPQAATAKVAPEVARPVIPTPRPAAAAIVANGAHVGVPNTVVDFEQVSFAIGRGAFNDAEAKVSVLLRNISGETLSSVQLAARLYIDGETTPAVELGRDSGDKLWVTFGDRGLAPGESGRFGAVLVGSRGELTVPDVLRSDKRMLVVRVIGANDGHRHAFAAGSQQWPAVAAHPNARAESTAAAGAAPRALDIAALRAAIRSGGHVGFGDGQVGIENVKVSVARGPFNRQEVRVQAEIVNSTAATLAWVALEGWLLERRSGTTDVIAAPDGRSARTFFASLGDHGLAAGGRRAVRLYQSGGEQEWSSPDALAAVASGQSQVVLRALEYADGRKATRTMASPAVKPLL